jgi:eukaryotic-like serine/threonine-protein kinase
MLKLAQVPDQDRAPQADAAPPSRAPRAQQLYYAFLSYSHKDEALADWVHRELERFKVPRALAGQLTANGVIPRRLRPIFRDRQELAAADDLGDEIREALAASRFLIVLCSPDAAKSRWTNAEIEAFKRTRPDGCVLAAIVGGEPFASDIPGRESEECFPPALRQKYDRRGRPTGKRAEPLAADLRDKGDGRRTGFLQLVAGMLGVGLDELVQRETTRRQRRFAWLSAASVAGMAITTTLAIAAIQARDAARDQRREAEGLVAFMLGDLKDKLEPIGRLDALDGVGSRVLAYYSKQDASELSDAALLQRARALSLTAQVAYLRGDYDGATRLYREAMAGTAEAVRRDPDDPQRLYDHAQNVFWVGDLARRLGEIRQAEAAYREYKRLADRMTEIEPDNLKYRMEVQYARENLGIVLMSQRRFAEAARHFEDALGPMESLAAIDPEKTEYQKEVSNLLAWVSDAHLARGRLDEAIAQRQRQIELLHRLDQSARGSVKFREELIPARQALGWLFLYRGQQGKAVEQFTASVRQAEELIPVEPGNMIWLNRAAQAQLALAEALLASNRHEAAVAQVRAGCTRAERLFAKDSSVPSARVLARRCLALRAHMALAQGATGEALTFANRALALGQSQAGGDPFGNRYMTARTLRLIGDVHRRSGDAKRATEAWEAALKTLPSGVPEWPREMNERAEILTRLGRMNEARPITQRLAAIGYQRTI